MGTIIPIMGMVNISISDVLFSKAQQQVLGLLYGQPDSDFYTNEIIRLTETGTGAVLRELKKLEASGFITVRKIGNQKRYQANPKLPFFAELRGIILKTFGLADILRKALSPLAKKLQLAFIYGSIAKQEDTAKSDIDLMIISDKITYADIFQLLANAEEKLCRKVNPTFYTPSEWTRKQKEGNNFIRQLLSQPKIFLIGTENELVTLGESGKGGSIKV